MSKQTRKENAIRLLTIMLQKGETLYTLRTPGRGDVDYIRVLRITRGDVSGENRGILDITHMVGLACGIRLNDAMGLVMSGGGYNKGFEAVETVSCLFGWGTYGLLHKEL
jgi:hypothetical protein